MRPLGENVKEETTSSRYSYLTAAATTYTLQVSGDQ